MNERLKRKVYLFLFGAVTGFLQHTTQGHLGSPDKPVLDSGPPEADSETRTWVRVVYLGGPPRRHCHRSDCVPFRQFHPLLHFCPTDLEHIPLLAK